MILSLFLLRTKFFRIPFAYAYINDFNFAFWLILLVNKNKNTSLFDDNYQMIFILKTK